MWFGRMSKTTQCIIQTERFDITADRFLEIVDGLVFGFAFFVRRDVWKARSEAAELGIGDNFNGE